MFSPATDVSRTHTALQHGVSVFWHHFHGCLNRLMGMWNMQVNAASNDLEDLPRDVVKMKSLVHFDVSDNVIETLPETVCKITSLRQLNVADNKIMEFPKV